MSTEIKVPALPESVADGTIATWHKKPGEAVKRDENLVDIETDKVVLEVSAPADGTLEKILKEKGETVKSEEVIALFAEGAVKEKPKEEKKEEKKEEVKAKEPEKKEKPQEKPSEKKEKPEEKPFEKKEKETSEKESLSPSERRRAAEKGEPEKKEAPKPMEKPSEGKKEAEIEIPYGERVEKRVPMSRLRLRIAERLVQAQQTAAMLTTFNEINMLPVMTLRQKYKDEFEKHFGVRLGFMSFFTKAVVEALKNFPAVNASIDGSDIVYHGYFDIGIAVSTPRGLVVPILRNAENLSMAEMEKQIADFAVRAKNAQLTMEEITGGTFSITNGGVFGSLMATPILNPPQSAILGMHKIEERPVVVNGEIVIRPMMYVALTYDHRIIDGRESVQFLVAVKELLEEPARLALGL